MSSMTEAIRLVISGDSKGAQRALDDLGRSAQQADNPISAFRRGLSLGGQHAISFRDRIGLVRTGLTKLSKEGLGGVNGAMQNFGTAASGAALKAMAWGTAIASAAVGAVAAVRSVIDTYIELGKQVGMVNRIVGTTGEEGNSIRVQLKMLGIDVDTGSKAFGKFGAALGQAQKDGTGPLANALKVLGISLKDQNGQWRTNADVLDEVRDKLSRLRTENLAAYQSTAKDIFGRGWQELDKWLSAAPAKIRRFKQIANDTQVDWGAKDLQKYLDSSREISVRWDDLQATIGQELMPLLSDVLVPLLKDIVVKVGDIADVMDRIPGKTKLFGGALTMALNPAEGIKQAFKDALALLVRISNLLNRLPVIQNFVPGDGRTNANSTLPPGGNLWDPSTWQRMATGGYVPPAPGGRAVVLGDGGEGEWAVPASKAKSFARSVLGGGSTVNVHVHVGTFVGSDASGARELGRIAAAELRRGQLAVAGTGF